MLEKNVAVNEQQLKSRKLMFEIAITANATPASKAHNSDLPAVCILRTEGKTAEADAIEDLSGSFTTADDENAGNSVFGVLLRGGDGKLGSINKVMSVRVQESSTSLATALAVTKHGTGGLSAGGNIAFTISGTGLRLDTESPKITCEVDYLLSE